MIARICKNCRFCAQSYLHQMTEGEHEEYECRRRAPTYNPASSGRAIWPIVDLGMSCGEFKAKGTAHVQAESQTNR